MSRLRAAAVAASVALLVPALAACEQEPVDRDVVALLVADGGSDRWRDQDQPAFTDAMDAECADCVVLTRDAEGDPATQQRQLTDVLDSGADVVVLNAVSGETGEELVTAASVPVIAYDRLVPGADAYVGANDMFSSRRVAAAVRDRLPQGRSDILVVSDGVAGFTDQVVKALGQRVRVRATLPVNQQGQATRWVAEQVAQARPVAAVVTAEDPIAAEVATGFAEAGMAIPDRPLITGRGAGLPAVRRLVRGSQSVTVHVAREDQAAAAAQLATAVVGGGQLPSAKQEIEGVPATLIRPTVVTLPTLTNTLVRQQVYTTEEICSADLLSRCEQLGLR